MSDLFASVAKLQTLRKPVSLPNTSQFAAGVTANIRRDPGVQARMSGQDTAVQNMARQQAFQDKLKTYGDWSKGQTNVVQTSNALKRRAADAAYQAKTARTGQSGTGQNFVGTGAVIGNAAMSRGYTHNRGGVGGYANGRIPANALAPVSFARGQMMQAKASSALDRLNAAYRQQFGSNISITDSYRSLDRQIALKRTKGQMAATPGTSVHGLGLALDLGGGINQATSAQHRWLQQNAPRFGFVNPAWARTKAKFEPWHWEYVG